MRTLGRRIISIIMSVITVLSCFAGLTFSVGAETSRDYEYEVLDDGTVSITKYNGDDTEIEIPSKIAGKKVTVIGRDAFGWLTDVTSVKIPYGVTKIDWEAFRYTGLVKIEIPDSVTEIYPCAFSECTKLVSITIPNSVTTIAWDAFYGCTELTKVTIPAGVEEIDGSAFSGCTKLEEINVDNDNENYISVDGVLFNKNMTKIIAYPCGRTGGYVIPDGVTLVGGNSFAECAGLTAITMPDSITEIEYAAFLCCTGLKTVVIPKGVTNLGPSSFANCSNLIYVMFPNGVFETAEYTFEGCINLTNVTVPGDFKSILDIDGSFLGYRETYKGEKIDNFTICGQPGSVAEEYASENGFKFVDINSCGHTDTCLRNMINETCEQNGYSGDLYCKVCGSLIKKGEQTDKTEHQFVNGKCTVCGAAEDVTDMKKKIASMSVGDTITFGSYPQTDVTSELGSQLTAAAPSTDEWTSYDYYYDGEQSDFMKYYDLLYNGDMYRGVYFTKYRPCSWDKTDIPSNPRRASNQAENGYGSNII